MTFVNFFTMAGGAIFMPALGRVIESFPRTGIPIRLKLIILPFSSVS